MINLQQLKEVFCKCLSDERKGSSNDVIVEGPIGIIGFQPEALTAHEAEIISMLEQLPVRFRASQCGESSFRTTRSVLDDNDGDERRQMEQLFYLGMAIGKVHCLLPNERWFPLPGKTPYYWYLDGYDNRESTRERPAVKKRDRVSKAELSYAS